MDFGVPQANFILQIVILLILFGSLGFKARRKYIQHGVSMTLAVILNIVSFVWVMGPSLLNLQEFIANNPSNRIALAAIFHGIFGAIALIFGIWLIVSWGFRSSTKKCVGKKKLMRPTLILWFTALLLGILYYAFAYLL